MSSNKSYTCRRIIAASGASLIGTAPAGSAILPLWRYLAPEEERQAQENVIIARFRVGLGQAHFSVSAGIPLWPSR